MLYLIYNVKKIKIKLIINFLPKRIGFIVAKHFFKISDSQFLVCNDIRYVILCQNKQRKTLQVLDSYLGRLMNQSGIN